jgi:hypothetical protein
MHFLRKLLARRESENPLVLVADMLSDPEARMWQEALRREGIVSLVKSPSGLLGEMAYTSQDFSLWTNASDAEQARALIQGRGNPKDPRIRHGANG